MVLHQTQSILSQNSNKLKTMAVVRLQNGAKLYSAVKRTLTVVTLVRPWYSMNTTQTVHAVKECQAVVNFTHQCV